MPRDPAREPSIGYLLVDAVRLMRRDFHARARGLGLTPALARLLFYVDREPGSRQADLAGLLDVSPVTAGRMIDRLVEQGLVRRRPDPADRRAVRVYVAARGEPLVAKMDEISKRTVARATRGFAAEERTALSALLGRVRGNLAGEA